MYCRNCGQETGGAKFCPECGAEQVAVPPQQPNPNTYQQPNQGAYQQPTYNIYNSAPPRPEADMTIGEWMITILISIIPLVGLICMLIWACGSPGDKPSRKNWAAANLIWTVIILLICGVVLMVTMVSASKIS